MSLQGRRFGRGFERGISLGLVIAAGLRVDTIMVKCDELLEGFIGQLSSTVSLSMAGSYGQSSLLGREQLAM
jgi:hypothetical protein